MVRLLLDVRGRTRCSDGLLKVMIDVQMRVPSCLSFIKSELASPMAERL